MGLGQEEGQGFWVEGPALGNGISAALPQLPINASHVKATGRELCPEATPDAAAAF